MERKIRNANIVYLTICIAVLLFFTYVMLDFFVIKKDYSDITPDELLVLATPIISEPPHSAMPDETAKPDATFDPEESQSPSPTDLPTPTPSPVLAPETDSRVALVRNVGEHDDGNIKITVKTYRMYETDIHVAEVVLSSLANFKTAFAHGKFGRNIIAKTSKIAEDNNAILAINGDYYGSREGGYVVRNGLGYRKNGASADDRNTYVDLAVLSDGSFMFFPEREVDYETVASWAPWQVFSFGPSILEDGRISVSESDDVMRCMGSNPRTCIAEIAPLHYLFVVSDGRTDDNDGLKLYQMAEFLQLCGAKNGYNLDGGGSSTMYFKGEIVNVPVNSGKVVERSLSDIVAICP